MQAPQRAAPEAWPGGKPLTLAELERWGGGGGGGGGAGRKAAAALHAAACGAVGSVAAGAGLPPRPTTGAAAAAGAGSAGQGAPLNDPVPPQGTAPVGTTACVSSWRYVDHIGAAVRAEPRIDGPRTEHAVAPGSIFGVSEERPGADGVLYLRLADGRGWLFDSVPGVGVLCARCADDGARAAPPGQAVEGDAPGDGEQCSGGGGQVADMPAFAPGDRVEYNSASLGWIPARVLQVNVDGTYNLDCKPWVRLERLRALAGALGKGDATSGQALARGSPSMKLPHCPDQSCTAAEGGKGSALSAVWRGSRLATISLVPYSGRGSKGETWNL
ncbi:unnamed protein product [Prorocentrum cordatum]|uniref:Uncharacterized protein n=1 Tax=Prorocentrum cordatum TaxID=2364126 RepID=A0ABN9Y8I3_9DINO|nr:unnamed protein product [Polarella glacialis]